MADDRPPIMSGRTYFNFIKPTRMLHQNVNRSLDVKQYAYERVSIFECQDGVGRSETHGPGWVCFTTAQNGDGSGGAPQGFMSMDVTAEGELRHSIFIKGSIANNKNVSSVVSSNPSSYGEGSTLFTVIAESGSLQVTRVTVSGRSHDTGVSICDDPRKRKPATSQSACSPAMTQATPDPLNGPCRDPRNGAKKDRRRPDDECEYGRNRLGIDIGTIG